jgi:hypothetical protein
MPFQPWYVMQAMDVRLGDLRHLSLFLRSLDGCGRYEWAMANKDNITKRNTYIYMETSELPFITQDVRILTSQASGCTIG